MKLRSFIGRLQELNAYLENFPIDTEGQKSTPLHSSISWTALPFHAHYVEKKDD